MWMIGRTSLQENFHCFYDNEIKYFIEYKYNILHE